MAEPVARCPICHRPQLAAFRPFCSRRCADVDLGRWLGGVYRIPAEAAPDEETPEPPPEPLDRGGGLG